jgi:2,4-didehydro-3-deoxy-L-rhamnonate hydrolase
MKIAHYLLDGTPRLGWAIEDELVTLDLPPATLREIVETQGPAALINPPALRCGTVNRDQVTMLPPVPDPPRNAFAVGWNYLEHLREGAHADRDLPEHPTFFTKPPTTLVGSGAPIAIDPELSACVDYEAELCLVIGRAGRNIPEDRALDHLLGYTLANDVSARDLQRAHGGQWFKGKAIDGSCPLGPWLVTPDEIPDPQQVDLRTTVNGELRQHASTADMAFPVARIVAELSRGLTLLPGDLILTGTPAGVGYARDPASYLADGDEVTVSSPQLGTLTNPVRHTDLTSYRTSA